jgi:hypothetical protein
MSGLAPLYSLFGLLGLFLGIVAAEKWGLPGAGGAVIGFLCGCFYVLLMKVTTIRMRHLIEYVRKKNTLLGDIIMWSCFLLALILFIIVPFVFLPRVLAGSFK